MAELQATLELSIEIQKFINVDLFHRGFYQVRIGLKVSPKFASKVEVSLPKNSSCSLVFPACVVNGTAVSKTFQILYKNEEVKLDDVVMFKVHLLVDGHRVKETLQKADFQISVELWFTEQNFKPDHHTSIHCVSSRTLRVHFNPIRGLHHHLPVFFDYFHLSAVTITIHMTLLALCQPYIRKGSSSHSASFHRSAKFSSSSPRSKKSSVSSLEYVLFGTQSVNKLPPDSRLHRARLVHWNLCSLLLSTYSSLFRRMTDFTKYLPPWKHLQFDSSLSLSHLDNLSDFAKECHKHVTKTSTQTKDQYLASLKLVTEEEFLVMANSDIAQLCGGLILLWHYFLEVSVSNERVRLVLARHAHLQRVKRFAEAFFIVEKSRESLLSPCETSSDSYQKVSEMLRKSQYLALLPSLDVECVEVDGQPGTLPVIYEEHFQELACRHNARIKSATELNEIGLQDVERRCSQGSLGLPTQATRPPPSPSATSLYEPRRKSGSKFFSGFKVDLDIDEQMSTNTPSSNKVGSGPKIKLRSRTSNFLKQFKKPLQPIMPSNKSSVILLGFKKLDCGGNLSTSSRASRRLPQQFSDISEGHIRHSQSTLSVYGSQLVRPHKLPNSESMPDLPSSSLVLSLLPPPPPPAKFRHASVDGEWPSYASPRYKDHRRRSLSPHPPKDQCPGRSSSETSVLASAEQHKNDEIWRDPYDEVFLNGDNFLLLNLAKSDKTATDPLFLNGVEDHSSATYEEVPCPPSPPSQFKDPPQAIATTTNVKVEDNKKEETVTTSEELMPPPAEFAEGEDLQLNNKTTSSQINKEQKNEQNLNKKVVTKVSGPEGSDQKCTLLELFAEGALDNDSDVGFDDDEEDIPGARRPSAIGSAVVNFVKAKEEFRKDMNQPWLLYSDYPSQASGMPYFNCDNDIRAFNPDGLHLVICVHGLDGNSADLRLVRTYLELGLPTVNFEFLMSERNQGETFDDFQLLTDRLVSEITYHIEVYGLMPAKISFIGHSLGNIIIRAALTRTELKPYLSRLYTLLSLSGPHLGTLYNTSGLVNMGMWFMQKWKKSGSLLQLSLKDTSDPRQSFLYKLSQQSGMEHFRNVLLFGSSQDRYVPLHSARIEMCKAAMKDVSSVGTIYQEMVNNLLQPLVKKTDVHILRYDVHHALASNSANSLIGRAAHIAVLDSELFIEKFMSVCGVKYFY